MGFTFTPPTFRLDFSRTRLSGLEMVTRSVSIGEFIHLMELRIASDEFLGRLADAIISWNVERDGQPVEPSADELKRLDSGAVRLINKAWLEAISGTGESLGKDSGSGANSLEPMIPMETA